MALKGGIEVKMNVTANKKVNRLRRGTGVTFTKFSSKIARQSIANELPALRDDLSYTQDDPPKRLGQLYIRTFELLRGWRFEQKVSGDTFELVTTNRTRYTKFVGGQPDLRRTDGGLGQAWMHKKRWPIFGGIIKRHYVNIQNNYELNMINVLEDQVGFTVKKRSKLVR